jgi:hypothetical protein
MVQCFVLSYSTDIGSEVNSSCGPSRKMKKKKKKEKKKRTRTHTHGCGWVYIPHVENICKGGAFG